jgi:hypothetical protein
MRSSIDRKQWINLFPTDELFNSRKESFRFTTKPQIEWHHAVVAESSLHPESVALGEERLPSTPPGKPPPSRLRTSTFTQKSVGWLIPRILVSAAPVGRFVRCRLVSFTRT